ncbi:MAG: CehA/McbA family metallohydrolase [Kofleriaceae bacterium]|nr:CehA/McbA family metallohydrolase [Kofleriaceae bacterium]
MFNRKLTASLTYVALLVGCGGDDKKPVDEGMVPLVEDQSIESGCTTAPPATGSVRAKYLSCDEEKVAGLLAAGREGDILLENSKVRFVIRGPGPGFRLHGTTGGSIVDAALHGREDQLLEIQPMLDWGAGAIDELVITSSGLPTASEPGVAEFVIRGKLTTIPLLFNLVSLEAPELIVEQRYRLLPDATALEIVTRSFSISDDSPDIAGLRDIAFMGGEIHVFVPGAGLTDGIASGKFFASEGKETSYGLVYDKHPSARLSVLDTDGILFLQAIELTTNAPPERRFFVVGDGSTSSVTDVIYGLSGGISTLSGSAPAGYAIAITGIDGRAITRARAKADGTFSAQVPPGNYELQCVQQGRVPGPMVSALVPEEGIEGIAVSPGAGGALEISVADGNGAAMPARIMLSSPDGLKQFFVGAEATEIALPPGDYDLSVSRGIEFGLFQQQGLVIEDGETMTLSVVLEREVDTTGWISMDSHLHSEMSTDSSIPLDQRLLSVAGEGVEVAISTDHDFIADYSPYIARLGLSEFVASQMGAEVSSTVVGHINGWPLASDNSKAQAGSPNWDGSAPNEIANLIRGDVASRVVQINHPRRGSSAVFDLIDLNSTTLASGKTLSDLGVSGDLGDFNFDVIEVANADARSGFEDTFADWLSFLGKGFRKTATGASDSHKTTDYSGRARTFVFVGVGQDTPSTVNMDAFNQAVKDGKAIVSQGAFVTIELQDPLDSVFYGPGELVSLQNATEVAVRIRVQAASWLPLKSFQVYENDQVVFEQILDESETQSLRYDQVITLPLSTMNDSFFLVRVAAASNAGPVLPDPGPSFTNPVFVDRDGDNTFAP